MNDRGRTPQRAEAREVSPQAQRAAGLREHAAKQTVIQNAPLQRPKSQPTPNPAAKQADASETSKTRAALPPKAEASGSSGGGVARAGGQDAPGIVRAPVEPGSAARPRETSRTGEAVRPAESSRPVVQATRERQQTPAGALRHQSEARPRTDKPTTPGTSEGRSSGSDVIGAERPRVTRPTESEIKESPKARPAQNPPSVRVDAQDRTSAVRPAEARPQPRKPAGIAENAEAKSPERPKSGEPGQPAKPKQDETTAEAKRAGGNDAPGAERVVSKLGERSERDAERPKGEGRRTGHQVVKDAAKIDANVPEKAKEPEHKRPKEDAAKGAAEDKFNK